MEIDDDLKLGYMSAFIEMKGLSDEYEQFETDKETKRVAEMKKVSVGDLPFDFNGHRSRYCYEMSGEDFDKGGSLNYILRNELDVPVYDPSTTDEYDLKEIKKLDMTKYKPLKELLGDDFDDVFDSLMDFVNQDNETFDYFLCDEFGFSDRVPSDDEIKEWFGNLICAEDDAQEVLDATFDITY